MTTQDEQAQLKHQLVLLTDAYIKLSENPVWEVFVNQFPELENFRQDAIEASDNLWWKFRTKCSDFNQ